MLNVAWAGSELIYRESYQPALNFSLIVLDIAVSIRVRAPIGRIFATRRTLQRKLSLTF